MKSTGSFSKQALLDIRRAAPGIVAGAFVGIFVVIAQGMVSQSSALSVTSPRDCDSNAVINCGALTTVELRQRYSQSGVAAIYSYFGIHESDIHTIDTTAKAGRIYKDGSVRVGNVTVATHAITAGRENIAGSTRVTSGGTSFYTRPPSVSFRSESLSAFVVVQDGVFKYAILAACGNPVRATAVPKSTQKPTPPPASTKPIPTPATPDTPISTQTPTSTPNATLVSAPEEQPAALPSAGPGAIITIALLAALGGYIFHMTHRRVKHARKARRAS